MSEPRRSNSTIEPPQHEQDEPLSRLVLPPRPSVTSYAYLLSEDIANELQTPILARKPVVPRRSSRVSLDKRSYSPIQMRELAEAGEEGSGTSKEDLYKTSLESGHLPPRSFEKTHRFLWCNLGYWRMPARHFSIFGILFVCTFVPCYYSSYGFTDVLHQSEILPFKFDCMDSGGWSLVGINLVPFQNFTFGEAKAVDLAWNWVVGRGLQGLLTLLAYRVFSDALLRVVELSAVPFELYATLALPSTKIELLWQVCKNLFKRGNWRVKMIFFWLIISTLYLIAVPGLMDAATAYETSYTTNFLWPASGVSESVDKIDWSDRSNAYDGDSLEYLTTPYANITPICFNFKTNFSSPHPYNLFAYISTHAKVINLTYVPWLNITTASASAIADFGSCQNSSYPDRDADGNYEVYDYRGKVYYWEDKTLNEMWWNQFKTKPLLALDKDSWASWNFYPTSKTSFQCIVEEETYRWGFSFEWLFLITIFNTVWLWGLWILWLDCDTNSEFCKKRRRLGVWRAIADISEAMREELGPNICAYSDDDLLKALQRRGDVKYYAMRGTASEPGHLGLSTRQSGKFVIRWGREYGREKID